MSRSDCPPACPVAWSGRQLCPCSWLAFPAELPANDVPPVRAGQLVDGFGECSSCPICRPRLGGLRGEVVCRPLARPFAWSAPPPHLHPAHTPLPAKVVRNGVPLGGWLGGGR